MAQINITPGQIKYIQVLRRRVFGADEAGYREMLAAQAGRAAVKSCKDLKGPEIDRVIKHLERCVSPYSSASESPPPPVPPSPRPLLPPAITNRQVWKIRDLWRQVSTAYPADREKALLNFLQRLTGKRKLEWLTLAEASRVIEAMDAMLRRSGEAENRRHGEKKDTGTRGHGDGEIGGRR